MQKTMLIDESYKLALDVISLYQNMRKNNEKVISRQLLRSGTSIGVNIKESDYADSNLEAIHKLKLALKECNQTIYWLDLIRDSKIYDADTTDIHNQCRIILRMLSRQIVAFSKRERKK